MCRRQTLVYALTLVLVGMACISPAWADLQIQVKGLFKNGAVIVVNGQQRVLRVGKTSPEGIKLVSADSRSAEVEVNGKRQVLSLSRHISASFAPTEKPVARIPRGNGGHYYGTGQINQRQFRFMVDTGATTVAMNEASAKGLGLDYASGRKVYLSTANGYAPAHVVMLDTVQVGDIILNNVEATVLTGGFPKVILLGNSFLDRVNLQRNQGLLVLEARY